MLPEVKKANPKYWNGELQQEYRDSMDYIKDEIVLLEDIVNKMSPGKTQNNAAKASNGGNK